MDKCQHVQELLADYRTGILSDRKSSWVEEHLQQCVDCSHELELLDGVLAIVDANTPEYEPPASLWNGVYNRITSDQPTRSTWFDDFRQWIARPVQAVGVGVAVIAIAVGLVISTGPHNDGIPMQMVSDTEYVQGHALYAGQAPLADRVSYLTVVAASSVSNEK